MVPVWVLIVTLVICIGIIIYDRNSTDNIFLKYEMVLDEYVELGESYQHLLQVLGYYRLRFGIVSVEDIENMVGIDMEKLNEEIEYGKS